MKNYQRPKVSKLKIFYFLILGVVFTIFILLSLLNIKLKKQNQLEDTYILPLTFVPEDYPQIKNKYNPQVSAQGAVILDSASHVPLFEKNSSLRFSPASTTKIMTALVALEYFTPNDILTIYQTNVKGSDSGFKSLEKFRFEDLLYAMLLPSSNEATLAIAQNYPGGQEAFVSRMNEKAKSYNLDDTYFEEPIGLLDESDYTTAIDLARLAAIALKDQYFAKVVSTKRWQATSLSGNKYSWSNLNKLLEYPGVTGVKTGFTEGAGQVLVSSKRTSNNTELIIVVMQSEDRFGDSEILLNYVENNLTYLSTRQE